MRAHKEMAKSPGYDLDKILIEDALVKPNRTVINNGNVLRNLLGNLNQKFLNSSGMFSIIFGVS